MAGRRRRRESNPPGDMIGFAGEDPRDEASPCGPCDGRRRSNPKVPPASCDPSARPLPPSALGKRVRVHLNLHNGCYVVTIAQKVAGYSPALLLTDVTSVVSKAGYARCREERSRNVHAYLEGTLEGAGEARGTVGPAFRRLRYNCLTAPPCFYLEDTGECLVRAKQAICLPQGRVWVRT